MLSLAGKGLNRNLSEDCLFVFKVAHLYSFSLNALAIWIVDKGFDTLFWLSFRRNFQVRQQAVK